MVDDLLVQGFNTIASNVFGSSLMFAIVVVIIVFVMLAIMRLPANIVLAFIFPIILGFCLFGYFPLWFKAISVLVVGLIWFYIMRGLLFNE